MQVLLCSVSHPNSSWGTEWISPAPSITIILWTLSRGKILQNANARKSKSTRTSDFFFKLKSQTIDNSLYSTLRYHQLMVAAGYQPHLQRPLLMWSTSQSVLTTPLQPPPPLVQFQTHQTQSTAQTPQHLVSARSCKILTCTHTEDKLEQTSSSTTSRSAGEEPGQRRWGGEHQDIGAQLDSLTLQLILCPR